MKLLDKYGQPDPVEWCERHIILDYGRFNRSNHPLLVEPLRAAAGMRGGIVGIIGSVQHIKTLTAQLWQLYGLHTDPSRAAMYDLTEDALRDFSDDKFSPLIESTGAIMDLIPSSGYKRTKFFTGTPFGAVRLMSANVLANRNSKTLERVSCDEAWTYAAGENWLGQIRDRMTAFPWSWVMLLPSSGQTAGSELDELWNRSTQRRWHIPCDCCGEMIPYIWTPPKKGEQIGLGGMRWGPRGEIYRSDGSIDYQALRESVYYQCQKCGGKMFPDPGRVSARNAIGRYIQTNPNGDEKIDMYHYNAMSHFPWVNLVEEWLIAVAERNRGSLAGIENFIRKRIAEPWSEGAYVSEDSHTDNAGNYLLGEKWETVSPQFIFCTVDVQKDHFYYVIRSWSLEAGLLRSRLLERSKVMSSGEIREACSRWEIPQGGLNEEIGCRVFLDGNYNPVQVQRLCALNGWMVFRGDKAKHYRHDDGINRIYGTIQYIDIGEGTAEAGTRFTGQFPFANTAAMNRLSLIREITDDLGGRVWTYARNCGETFKKQLNAWAKVRKEKKDGQEFFDWVQRYTHDHYHSCEKMQLVCAAMAGLVGGDGPKESED